MRERKRNITTNSKEIYKKLNMLHFSNEVVIKNVKPIQITKIINSINKNKNILDYEIINGKYIIIKKKGLTNFNIYLK